MRSIATQTLVLFALLVACIAEGRASNTPDGPNLSTMGRGRVSAPADRAVIELTATSREQTALAAKNAVENMVATLLSGLKALEVPAENYSIGGLALDREIEYREDKEVVLGYLAQRGVTVTVKDTTKIDPVLQAALKAGITQVDSVEYSLSNWGEFKQRARSLAVADARQKAQFLATQFGVCVGDIYSIDTGPDPDDGTYSEIVVTARKGEEPRRAPEYVPGRYDVGQVEVKAQLMVVFNLRTRDCS